jgi:branched-chain amino acid transport system ATP-binding protein
MAEPLLQFADVRSGYGEAVVLDGISFDLPAHGSLALLGRNGVGKTTLLLTAMGFVTLARGTIHFNGEDISRLAPHKRAHLGLGWVPQERDIFPSLSVEENLTVAARPGRWDIAAIWGLFPRLKERRSNMGNQLSGGEQQMLTIARTLMGNPDLLLLDEPSEGLAPIIVQTIGELISQLHQMGVTILMAEQNMHFCLKVATHATVIDKGQVVYRDTIEGLKASDDIKQRYLAI